MEDVVHQVIDYGLNRLINSKAEPSKLAYQDGVAVIELKGTINQKQFNKFADQYQQLNFNDPFIIDITTTGGEVTWAHMIATAIKNHGGHVTAYVPRYAFSSGTIIAIAADKIVLSSLGALGPADSYIFGFNVQGMYQVLDKVYQQDPPEWTKNLPKWLTTLYLWFTLGSWSWLHTINNYCYIMLQRVDKDHQETLTRLMRKHEQPDLTAEYIYSWFTQRHHHQTAITFDRVNSRFYHFIELERDMFSKINNRKVPSPFDNLRTELESTTIDTPHLPPTGNEPQDFEILRNRHQPVSFHEDEPTS